MRWPEQLENGELLTIAEQSGFEIMITSDQNMRYQQNFTNRKIALLVLGSNIWPIVQNYRTAIAESVDAMTQGSHTFIKMSQPPKRRK